MRSPGRVGGALDLALGYLALLLTVALTVKGVVMHEHDGASWWWALTAGVLALLSLHGLYRRHRARGRGRA
ncbi:hypothetical protein [Actinacidiphila acidipaludis]|uniref:Uncharacterized protein n=1 Tax=Actinacidiphila acidipaludis TaxID=2873382 RepID=A0ABS7QFE6_9ACTN|nr:hypothetical protein [Streptomyces acidipaludis]MBY8881891.1 hypothetical protein [Streptomyces acidipaludis]